MKLVIDIPDEYYELYKDTNNNVSMNDFAGLYLLEIIRNGKQLTKNEYICEEVRITTSKGEKFNVVLDKARMMLWLGGSLSVEFAQKELGWKMEGKDADSN